jgi:hypothetical protein
VVIIVVESLPVHQPGGESPVEQAANTNGSDVADDHTDARKIIPTVKKSVLICSKVDVTAESVLWIRNFFFRIRIRILFDQLKVTDPVSDPTLNIISVTMPTIKRHFHGIFKAYFLKKM